jgi:hypothetical protein
MGYLITKIAYVSARKFHEPQRSSEGRKPRSPVLAGPIAASWILDFLIS